jgi:hypothetical protein
MRVTTECWRAKFILLYFHYYIYHQRNYFINLHFGCSENLTVSYGRRQANNITKNCYFYSRCKKFIEQPVILDKLRVLSPRANYTDRETATCRGSQRQLFRIEGCRVVTAADPLRQQKQTKQKQKQVTLKFHLFKYQKFKNKKLSSPYPMPISADLPGSNSV